MHRTYTDRARLAHQKWLIFVTLIVMLTVGTLGILYGEAAVRFVGFGLTEGDWLNDSLTGLPVWFQNLTLWSHGH